MNVDGVKSNHRALFKYPGNILVLIGEKQSRSPPSSLILQDLPTHVEVFQKFGPKVFPRIIHHTISEAKILSLEESFGDRSGMGKSCPCRFCEISQAPGHSSAVLKFGCLVGSHKGPLHPTMAPWLSLYMALVRRPSTST